MNTDAPLRVYVTRWYVCFVFVIFCTMQSSMWGFYSPIQQPLEHLYGWDDDFIKTLSNVANITFCVLVLPLGALVGGPRGVRVPLLATAVALCLNAGLRCLPLNWVGQRGYDVASVVSMLANGVAGTLESACPPLLLALWFPVHERATATAIMATANTLGTSVGFLVAFAVPSNGTSTEIAAGLARVNYSFFGVCVLTLAAMVVYFPSRPPTPPAASCSVEKVAVLPALKRLVRHGRFWLVVLAMAIPLGFYSAWLNVLDLNLKDFAFTQSDAGWVGFGSASAGALAGVLMGRVADAFPGRLPQLLAAIYTLAACSMACFSLICFGVITFNRALVFTTSILAGFCFSGTYPLFFELACETVFPIPESCASAFMVMSQAVIQSVFLSIPITGSAGTKWMNYVLIVAPLVGAVALCCFCRDRTRLDLDLGRAAVSTPGRR